MRHISIAFISHRPLLVSLIVLCGSVPIRPSSVAKRTPPKQRRVRAAPSAGLPHAGTEMPEPLDDISFHAQRQAQRQVPRHGPHRQVPRLGLPDAGTGGRRKEAEGCAAHAGRCRRVCGTRKARAISIASRVPYLLSRTQSVRHPEALSHRPPCRCRLCLGLNPKQSVRHPEALV